MLLKELVDITLLNEHLLNRVVSEQSHPQHHNLKIYNYTHIAQHENIWDDVSEQCRGLIVDSNTGEILARPFRKFFGLNFPNRPETMEENLPVHKPRVLEKLDGSLGILFKYGGYSHIATRGSFVSEQAIWATEWYKRHFYVPLPTFDQPVWKDKWPEGYTPLFEIIYEENRIVVSYEYEELVLLGLVNIETGFELSPEEVAGWADRNGLRSAREYNHSLSECQSDRSPNIEGFVLQYWSNKAPIPLRLKIKTEDYVRLHKVITGLNPKGIWEHLSKGLKPELLWLPAHTNKEFCSWCQGWINTFQRMYNELDIQAVYSFGAASIRATKSIALEEISEVRLIRKSYAMAFQTEPSNLQAALFSMLDGRDYKEHLWKILEPKIQGKEAFMKNGDEFNGV